MSKNSQVLHCGLALSIFILLMKLTCGSASAASQPLIIDKVDPWSPLTGLEGVPPCLKEAPMNEISNWAFAWMELYNTESNTLQASNITINVRAVNPDGISGTGSSISAVNNITLETGERCLIPTADKFSTRLGVGGSEGNGPPAGAGKDGAVVSISYVIANVTYHDSTPALSDPYGDGAYWKLQSDNDSSKNWHLVDPYATDRMNAAYNTAFTFSSETNDRSLIVNATVPVNIHVPSISAIKLTFTNATTKKLADDGSLIYDIDVNGNPLVGQQRLSGHSTNGTDTKFVVMNQTGWLEMSIQVKALSSQNGYLQYSQPKVVSFSALVMPEFPNSPIIIAFAAIGVIVLLTRIKFFKDFISTHNH